MLSEPVTYCIACAPPVQIPYENRTIDSVIPANVGKNPAATYKHEPSTLENAAIGQEIQAKLDRHLYQSYILKKITSEMFSMQLACRVMATIK